MSSHGGQQNFPFGYQQENIQGLGLPEFMNPGPPPGQPLLNADDFQNLDNFFHDFDSNALAASKQNDHPQYGLPPDQQNFFNMPPMFVGSETALAQRPSITPNQLQTPAFPYGDIMMGQGLPVLNHANAINSGLHGPSYPNSFPAPLLPQFQNTASIPQSHNHHWAPEYPAQNMMNLQYQPRPGAVNFGTDNRFQASGYVPPIAPADPDMVHPFHPMDIFEPASGSTTQPNTQPNTQPSSPTWSKKRTFDDFHQDPHQHNGFLPPSKAQLASPANSSPPKSATRPARGFQAKTEGKRSSKPQAPSAASKSRPTLDTEPHFASIPVDQEQDAEAEDDDDATAEQARSSSPTSWPSGVRPSRVTKPPPQAAKPARRKKSLGTSTPIKPKPKTQRTSSVSQAAQAARTPLSLAQKKANHTSSEQRRRDATARAYAELYDLVPELEELGKQSTMKKLEVVVDKVSRVKQQVEELSARLGIDPSTGAQLATAANDNLLHNGIANWSR